MNSLQTRGFTISNPVSNLTLSPVLLDLSGTHGIGNPHTIEVQQFHQEVETFPTYVDLPGADGTADSPATTVEIELSALNRADGSDIDVFWILSTLSFKVFSKQVRAFASAHASGAGRGRAGFCRVSRGHCAGRARLCRARPPPPSGTGARPGSREHDWQP